MNAGFTSGAHESSLFGSEDDPVGPLPRLFRLQSPLCREVSPQANERATIFIWDSRLLHERRRFPAVTSSFSATGRVGVARTAAQPARPLTGCV